MKKAIPSLISGREVSDSVKAEVFEYLSNWPKLSRHLTDSRKKLTSDHVLDIMVVEASRPRPREGILLRLLARYISVHRNECKKEMERFCGLKANKVIPTKSERV